MICVVLFVMLTGTLMSSATMNLARSWCQGNGVFYLLNTSASMSYSTAQQVCNDEGVNLATPTQLQKAQNDSNFNVCWIGWLDGNINTKQQVAYSEDCKFNSTYDSSQPLVGAFCYNASAVNISISCRPNSMPTFGVQPYKGVLIGVVTGCAVGISLLLLAIIVYACLYYQKQKDEVDSAWHSNTLISPYLSVVRHWDSTDPLPIGAPSN